MMAKAVVFWEPSTAKCAPLSRQDEVQDFCKSNIAGTMVGQVLENYGLVQGLQLAFEHIDRAGVNEIVRYVCPDKYRAWNFLPCKTGGTGSIEFRRPPGVVTAKKTKHWIAFTMAFVDMAVQFDPSVLPSLVYTRMDLADYMIQPSSHGLSVMPAYLDFFGNWIPGYDKSTRRGTCA